MFCTLAVTVGDYFQVHEHILWPEFTLTPVLFAIGAALGIDEATRRVQRALDLALKRHARNRHDQQ